MQQIVFGYFDLYFLLFKTIKSYMKPTQKMVNNLINETIFPFKGQIITTIWVILGDHQLISKHTFHRINPSTYLLQFYLQ